MIVVYMLFYVVGSGIGVVVGSVLYVVYGWSVVCGVGVVVLGGVLMLWVCVWCSL